MRQFDFSAIAAFMGRNEKAFFTPTDLGVLPHPLVEKGIFIPATQAKYVKCPCGCGRFENVLRNIVCGNVKYSVYCQESGGLYDISPDDLRLWTICVPAILKEIQHQFSCPSEPEMRCSQLWYVGESDRAIVGRRRQIFFTVQMTKEVESMLPEGVSQILIMGELHPFPTDKFKDRIFQMHDIMKFKGDDYYFDHDLIESRLQKIESAEKPKAKVMPKNAVQKSREEIIKEYLINYVLTLRNAYWTAMDRERRFKMPKKPTGQVMADYIKNVTNGTQTPNQSTVNRTIKNSTDKELTTLWENITDITFIRDYKRRKKQPTCKDIDSEYIAEMFEKTALEPLGRGFHTI